MNDHLFNKVADLQVMAIMIVVSIAVVCRIGVSCWFWVKNAISDERRDEHTDGGQGPGEPSLKAPTS